MTRQGIQCGECMGVNSSTLNCWPEECLSHCNHCGAIRPICRPITYDREFSLFGSGDIIITGTYDGGTWFKYIPTNNKWIKTSEYPTED